MRHSFCLSVLVSLSLSTSALASTVSIGALQLKWMTLPDVNRACTAIRPVAACTVLRDAALTCDCIKSGNEWRRHVTLTAVPVTYISDAAVLNHEMWHVADFKALLRQYAAKVESRRFQSAGDCAVASGRVQAAFHDVMIAIRDESARRRDGAAYADATYAALAEAASSGQPITASVAPADDAADEIGLPSAARPKLQ